MIELAAHRESPLVLVVDDDMTIRLLTRESLEQTGLQVEEAEDGASALSAFKELQPDLVLLDIDLPDVDGFTVCEAIREMPDGNQTPIVMITGADDIESINRAYEVGATDFVIKPINWIILQHRLRYMLRASHASNELRENQARLANAQSIAHLGNWDWDIKNNELTFSDETYHIFGLERGRFKNTREALLNCVHPDDKDSFEQSLHEALYRQKPFTMDHRILLPDGSTRTVQQEAEVTFDETGEAIWMAGTVQDITERKQTEEATKAAYTELNQIFETAGSGMRVIDKEFNVLRINTAFSDLSGIPKAEAVGKKCYEGFHGPICHTPQCTLSRLLDGEEKIECEVENERPDGTRVPCILTATPFRDPYGELIGIVQNFNDITERKQTEEKQRQYSEQLEENVEERTKELQEAHEQLVRREKLAVMGQLAGGLGHELRNPLGAIKNAIYLLNMVLEDPEPEVKETLEIIEKEVGISQQIITSLLDFARPKPPTRHMVDINDVVQEAVSRVPVPENVEVVRQLSETLATISADPGQLTQVFENLSQNAIQAMPEGGQFTVKSEAPSPEWVTVSCTDTGVGMDDETSQKVFEALFTTKARGIGLGLALCKMFVEAHGGTIDVESALGKGTTFTVSLPIARKEQE
jgi:PAS domain S-box-containing protein